MMKDLVTILEQLRPNSPLILPSQVLGENLFSFVITKLVENLDPNSSEILERYLHTFCALKTLPSDVIRDKFKERTAYLQQYAQKNLASSDDLFWNKVDNEWVVFTIITERFGSAKEVEAHLDTLNDWRLRRDKKVSRKNSVIRQEVDLKLPDLIAEDLTKDHNVINGNMGGFLVEFFRNDKVRIPSFEPTKGEHPLGHMIYHGTHQKRYAGGIVSDYINTLKNLQGTSLEKLVGRCGIKIVRNMLAAEYAIIDGLNARGKAANRGSDIRKELKRIGLELLKMEEAEQFNDTLKKLRANALPATEAQQPTSQPIPVSSLATKLRDWADQIQNGSVQVATNPLDNTTLLLQNTEAGLVVVAQLKY
jgi:hypothetical protein